MYVLSFFVCIASALAVPTQRFLNAGKLQIVPPNAASKGVASNLESMPLRLHKHLLLGEVTLGDGRSFQALIDTGSGNLAVPSSNCASPGCRGRRGFDPDEDETGSFVSGTSDLHLAFATGKMAGTGFRGKVCLGHVCGQAGFLVSAWESPEFARYSFDAILGLGPPGQALRPEFNVISAFSKQKAMPEAAFLLSLSSQGNSSLTMGSTGVFGANATSAANATHSAGTPPWLAADARHGEWAVHLSDINLDGKASGACGTQGCRAVLDSGCSGIALPEPALKALESRLKLHGCTPGAIQELPTLGFVFGNGRTYEVGPDKYVEVATPKEGDDSEAAVPHCRLVIRPTGDFSSRTAILGLPFLLDRDIVFDQGNMRVGLADAALGKGAEESASSAIPSDLAQL
jgi:hypothetical protein